MDGFHNHGMLGTWLIGDAECQAAQAVLQARSLFRHYGPDLQHFASRFEHACAAVFDSNHALAVNSGTSALRCALTALGVGPGDEIIVPPCTFIATVNAIVLSGAVPVFAEIDDELGLDPASVRERCGPRTVGIMPVHLQGFPCRIEALCDTAAELGLWVLEDAAQAMGVTVAGRPVGTFGDLGVFSLQAHKTITCGEGGVLLCRREPHFRRARRYQDQGGERRGDAYPDWSHPEAGFGENLKISELHAAVALAQLERLPHIGTTMRRLYTTLAQSIDLGGRTLRPCLDADGAIPYAFLFYAHHRDDRDTLLRQLAARDIPADGLYDHPLYREPPLVRWAAGENVFGLPPFAQRPHFEPCPRSEILMARLVRIPLSPAYGQREIDRLCEVLGEICVQGVGS